MRASIYMTMCSEDPEGFSHRTQQRQDIILSITRCAWISCARSSTLLTLTQWCRIRWTLTEYLVGVATGQPYTHPILYGHCVGIGRHQQDILRAVVSDYMAY